MKKVLSVSFIVLLLAIGQNYYAGSSNVANANFSGDLMKTINTNIHPNLFDSFFKQHNKDGKDWDSKKNDFKFDQRNKHDGSKEDEENNEENEHITSTPTPIITPIETVTPTIAPTATPTPTAIVTPTLSPTPIGTQSASIETLTNTKLSFNMQTVINILRYLLNGGSFSRI